ncbi:S-layer homology domain-containing protein [uncultured Dysosmobacter sp.]|uniref:S-layer homology domain-containing protein n=1 Tax=uncultured Dysosmobacter sp. TaxID=2591384 RepID=UPI002635B1C8|nr:S-layer homology domain-containing protein [uncultured Dysosmobacter sp.]
MKHLFRKTLSLFLALTLTAALSLPAAASEALGDDLTAKDTLLHEETQLSTNVFWSTSYSDRRTENLITYTPNDRVTPIVTYGDVLTDRSTISAMAKRLEAEDYRVVAGINGDFYNVNTGLPIGIVITEGVLRSSDAGYYAIGFREDGSAVLGKPGVKVTADLGYQEDDGSGMAGEASRQITAVNKARVSSGGIYLYTYDFNAKHTTGTTEAGVDVVCTIEDGELAIGETVTLTVERVLESASATAIREDQMVLSANLQSDAYHVDALRNIPVGAEITLTVTAASDEWNDVEYAVGALYSLVEHGSVAAGLQAGAAPRTAVGQRPDGTLLFYTIDGRKSGHSIGATMTQVAQRLMELGCTTALCLDGGGSTTLAVTAPDELEAARVNTPSDGGERSVSNQIFLVADNEPSGKLSHFYVSADYDYVLAGSRVNISASAVDTNYIPMDRDYDLDASAGDLDGNVLTTPSRGGEITITAESGRKRGTATVYAIADPTDVAIRSSSGAILTTLSAVPGTTTALTGSAAYNHIALKADAEAFDWEVTGDIGTIDRQGNFTATTPGTGTITATAGGRTASVQVTVSQMALRTVEDFESGTGTVTAGMGITPQWTNSVDLARMGRGALRLDYSGLSGGPVEAGASYDVPMIYTGVNLWVRGSGVQNSLYLLTSDGFTTGRTLICTLEGTDWKQYSVSLPEGTNAITGFAVEGLTTETIDEETGETVVTLVSPDSGYVYIDQMVATFSGTVDNTVPKVTLQVNGTSLTGTVSDAVDGVLPQSAVSAAYDGKALAFQYNSSTGTLSAALPAADGSAHRVTVTAKDGSGNIGRASCDIPAAADWVPVFSDTKGYWAAAYVDHLYTSGITTGYADGTFRPDQNITRAQFAVMLYRYLGLDESKYAHVELPFADSGKIADYAVPAIKALYTEGIINGSTGKDGRMYFNPNNPLTRAQAATMIGRTQEKGYAAVELTFSDAKKIPAYAAGYIQTMAAQGIISGYTDGSFKPNNNITRGQMAKILYNLM